ncbi:hypothetical protein ACHAWC_008928 [Mediolabrus comicus]
MIEQEYRASGNSASIVTEVEERLNNEIEQLKKDIWRVGDPEKPQVLFGELFDDEQTQQHYEGLAATLKAAKKRGIVTYKSPILLKGAHDKVMVNLVDTSPQQGGSSESTMATTTTNSNSENDGEKDKRKEAKAKLFAALSEE